MIYLHDNDLYTSITYLHVYQRSTFQLFDTLPNNDMMPPKHSQALIAAFTEMVSTCPGELGFLIKSQPFEPKKKYAELTRWAPENQL